MEALKPGEIRVHLTGGHSYVSPEANKQNIVNGVGSIERIEHYKAPQAVLISPPKTRKTKKKRS